MPIIVVNFKIHEKTLGATDYRGNFIVGELGGKITTEMLKNLFKVFVRELNHYVKAKKENV